MERGRHTPAKRRDRSPVRRFVQAPWQWQGGLGSTDHPLSLAQREGITLETALAIAARVPGIKFVVK